MDLMDAFPAHAGEKSYEGYIKVKLVHAQGFSVLLPDLVFSEIDGWRWFQSQYFSPCLMSFQDDAVYAQLNVDTDNGARLFVGFTGDCLLRQLPDGSSVYRCRITGLSDLPRVATGTCVVESNGSVLLRLYHHTSTNTIEKILESGYFLSSRWNIQGNKQLENVEYVYFTSLPRICSDDDLVKIAMATNGSITLLPTNGLVPQDVIRVDVYRENTLNRRASLGMLIPSEVIAPHHVWRHAPNAQPVYYEVSSPRIFRVGLLPGTVLPFDGDRLNPINDELKRFDYAVLGDADTPAGLIAPYDEEHTQEIFKIERSESQDLFEFWRQHANTDVFTGRPVEMQRFQEE